MKITDTGAAIPAAAVITVANGHAPDLAERPYWQDQPCPPWCTMVVPHQDHDRPEDRFHLGVIHDITLTLEAGYVVRFPDGKGGTVQEVSPSFINAGLWQGWREREARVLLVHAGTHDIELTISEARELTGALSTLLDQVVEVPGGEQ